MITVALCPLPFVRLSAMLSVNNSNSPITHLPVGYDIGMNSDQRAQITLLPENICIEICYDTERGFALCDFNSHSIPIRFTDSSVTLRDALKALGYRTDRVRLTFCDIQDAHIDNVLDTPIRDMPLSQIDLDTSGITGASNITYSNGVFELTVDTRS